MQAGHLTRRFALLLPFALAACGDDEAPETNFQPLRYNYLPPIQLNVASIAIEQRFFPSGIAPDVSNLDPEPPVQALKAMANDRLQAFGTSNKAVFAVLDGSMSREGDTVTGAMAVSLSVLDDSGTQLGFAEARVQSRHTGRINGLRAVLYDLTKSMMDDMNVEFEYQIRHNLKDWITVPVAPGTPVEQTPLTQPGTPSNQPPPPMLQPVMPPDQPPTD